METKTALVTGSTSGIGLGVATSLAQKGYHVIMCGSRSKEDALEAITQVKSSALHSVHYVQADLKTEAGMVSLCKEADSICPGGVDILVNNAGMQHVTPVEDCSLAKWNEIVAINLTAPFYLISHFVPRMKQKDEAKKRLFCDSQPTGKPVQVSQIADLVLFLCSPGADSMTGTSLVMDGGTIAK
ncbi:D-beta-hydroxybutyrate dehydrogenase-like [Ylistrum balloti]|uniref:D-beta-hydroxybutyrate dehydrogenase-like n=1 Tax=Ylistrum balloti TaxID=509963 RepID=UPI002905AB65|nr:D-beta-hydroxybutyrate dehydrogenase-like [Ylistrum balloti]